MFKEAREITASGYKQTWEDKVMRNVAFSLMLVALAMLQVAVVSTELSGSNGKTAAVEPAPVMESGGWQAGGDRGGSAASTAPTPGRAQIGTHV